MNRRSFLKGLLAGAAAAVAAPLIAAVPETPKKFTCTCHGESSASLRQRHGFDVEKDLTDCMAFEIQKEIDAEILAAIRAEVRKKHWLLAA